MIRKLIRWLARHEIAEAYLLGCHAGWELAEADAQKRLEVAFAHGELHGQEQAFLAVEQEVGLNRRVGPQDVRRARKRSVN